MSIFYVAHAAMMNKHIFPPEHPIPNDIFNPYYNPSQNGCHTFIATYKGLNAVDSVKIDKRP